MDDKQSVCHSVVVPELYFLISKFLSAGPLKETAKVLINELEQKKVLPKRIDWLGVEHDQSYAELERKYPHISPNHLLEICCRIGPILDKELVPSVSGIISLLGAGRQNLLRTTDTVYRSRSLLDHCTRIHRVALPDSLHTKPTHHFAKVLIGREHTGSVCQKQLVPTNFYNKTNLLRRTVGHLSAVYCVLFDRTGKYIITGADDLLVKLWSAVDGRLLTTFRGASAEITDIAINLDNTLLAAGSLDRILRVWDLQTAAPIAVLQGHTGMITSVNFCPSPRGDLKYLVTTSTDGSIAFWQYTCPRGGKTVFAPKPIQYHEKLRPGQAQMMCTSFSPGGIFLAAGSADHHVRVYIMSEDGPKRILETEQYTDAVDSIQWAHSGLKFVSGSKDGTAHVWKFESQQWKSTKFNMSDRLSSCPEPEEGKKLKVTMVAWDYSDKYVITAVNDFTIKIWNASTGKLHRVLRGHKDELYVLESNPKDEFVLLSAGHDGQLFLWDIENGVPIAHFLNNIEGQGHGGVFDAKWSPDGTMIAATDSHGHILIYGLGSGHERFKTLPTELFFHTDYRPLLRDAQHVVLDEQTQTMPHLMPPPFLVDVDGNPHPPAFQRLVPGREDCSNDQLVPNISVGPEGVEVVDGNNYSNLDRLIEALANRYNQDQAPDSNNERENNQNNSNRLNGGNVSRLSNGSRLGLRRVGDVEGVRQSSGNWDRETCYKYIRRIFVRPIKHGQLQALKQNVFNWGQHELEMYKREMRRRPIMINTSNTNTALKSSNRASGGNARRVQRSGPAGPRPVYRTRAARDREEEEPEPEDEEENEESSNSSDDTSYSNVNVTGESSSSDSDSSDYSDWVADKPGPNLEPPKRLKRKPVRNSSPSSDVSQAGGANKANALMKSVRTGEIPDIYRPPEWLSEVIPRKAPYYPQMGDEIVYFRQGHQRYLEAVRAKKPYKLTNSSEPWKSLEIRDHEVVRVIGIKYEIRPPRLCCMKLAIISPEGDMTGASFAIKYHDMPDVIDFLVLRQTYDLAVERNWMPGDRFRCMIDDCWWTGQIESRNALSEEFPDSLFMCFRVRWDNGEYEYMSPWDMEPIDDNRLPDEVGGAVPVLPEELRATLYQPKAEEWPRGDRDASCRRIINGLEQVMGLSVADHFLAPVDLNAYPDYAFNIEYPIDLTTIKARFENHFYRRITSAQFDVRYLATNAEKFNVAHSDIVRKARIVTDLCLRIIREPNDVDVSAVYHQLMDTYLSTESESDNDNENEPGPSTSTAGPSSSAGARRSNKSNKRQTRRVRSETDWKVECRELLEVLWQCNDSTPFREPVDTLDHPDYLQIVDTPMDLRTVKEDLLGGNYETPLDFAKDVRLIFQNSRNYNTNKKSRIYAMTLRLSTLFDSRIKKIIYNWKDARRRAGNGSPQKPSPSDRNRPGPSTRAGTSNGVRHHSSDDDDDDDEDDASNRRGRNRVRNGRVTSSLQHEAVPGPSRRNLRVRNASRGNSQEEAEDEEASESTSSGSSSDSSDGDSSHGIPVTDLGRAGGHRRYNKDEDSEDSYKPASQQRRGQKRKKQPKHRKKDKKKSKHSGHSDDDDDRPKRSSRATKSAKSRRGALIQSSEEGEGATSNSEYNPNETPKKRAGRRQPKLNTSQESEVGNEERSSRRAGTSRSQNVTETDHSYHLPVRNVRRAVLESENEQEHTRPTRASARKAILDWARMSDVEEEESQDSGRRRPTTRKKTSESEGQSGHSVPSTSRRAAPAPRQVRTNRNTRVLSEPEGSDDEPLATSQQRNPSTSGLNKAERPTRSVTVNQNGGPSTSSYRRQQNEEISSVISRRSAAVSSIHATRSQTNNADAVHSSSSVAGSVRRGASFHVQTDHDYGEPGPSTLRNTRRMLSRHQRNADELDPLNDPLEGNASFISSRLRMRNNINSTTGNTREDEGESRLRQGRFRSSQESARRKSESEEDDSGGSDEGTEGSSNRKEPSDGSDSDDDQPLTSFVPTNPRSVPARTRVGNNQRRRKRFMSDHDEEEDEQDKRRSGQGSSQESPRTKRNQKRPKYNEETDESSGGEAHNRQARRAYAPESTEHIRQTLRRHNSGQLASQVDYHDDSESNDNDPSMSVSSRGRVRKINPKARGLFRE